MNNYTLGEVTNNYDNLRVPLSENERSKKQGEYRYYGAQEVIDYIDEYIYDGKYILVAEDGNNLLSRNKPLCTLVEGKFWVNNHAHVIQGNEIADTTYLYYLLNRINIKGYVTGSAQPKLNQNNLNKIKISLPKIEEQIEIASKIELFDKKINNNLRIKEYLEEYMQLLYHEWFVDFNFPNEYGNRYSDNGGAFETIGGKNIPVGWDIIPLNNIVEKKTDAIVPQENPSELYKYYSIPVYDETKTYSEETGENIMSNKFLVEKDNLLISKLNPWFKRVVYPINIDSAICSTEFVVLKPLKHNILEYLYIIATSDRFTNYCTNASSGTSNSHKRVNPDYMIKYKIPYQKDIVEKFNGIVHPLVKKIHLLIAENKYLGETRDLLVRKLIK
ncbi:restriction endonuclease subunit S [Clostridium perfringens]|uniref:restriction endonuclease subunit S n=1 Tax=Clostridium perfringens TaxID=1502 RepID=UPI0018E45E3F|nr:restriction endonuclease subunit S [Clostridium perfringens]